MWPWGHAAVGYLLYLGWTWLYSRTWPSRSSVLAVLVATQIPDFIDKPLAWTFHVLPSGRSLGHSLLFAIPLLVVLGIVLARTDRSALRIPVAIGYLSGVFTDAPTDVLRGDFQDATFLIWPLLPPPEYETDPTFGAHFAQLEFPPALGVGFIGLVLVAVVLAYNLSRQPID